MNEESYQQAPPVTRTNSMALTSLIAGIIGWTAAPFLGSVVAIVTGHIAKKEIKERMGREGGDGMATAGLVMGYLQLIPTVFCVCSFFVFPPVAAVIYSIFENLTQLIQ